MSEHTPKTPNGNVSERDREIMRKQGRAQAEANRGMRPPGTLKAALEAMHQIAKLHGIDPRDYIDEWSDRESHMAYLDAVHKKMARDRENEDRGDDA